MALTKSLHSFHTPVMKLAYTIDSLIRVAQYGISSVISIIDDEFLEKMNGFYSKKFNLLYQEITKKSTSLSCLAYYVLFKVGRYYCYR
jgi:hypothetical protein